MVGNFRGSNFRGLGNSDDFVGLYFRGVSLSYNYYTVIFVDKQRVQYKIHENLNPTKITNHMVSSKLCM